jgi:hypothetical protein
LAKVEKFEWVSARHNCSLGIVFEKLRLDVKNDVAVRVGLRNKAEGSDYGFHFSSSTLSICVSVQNSSRVSHSVIFRLEDNYIVVHGESDRELFRASVALDKSGQCRILIYGQEFEDWQFRQRALEPIFFGDSTT